MNEQIQDLEQQIFVPTLSIKRITIKHTLGKLLVTPLNHAENVCGVARRIGYTGKGDDDLALYRLKIKREGTKNFVTLPSIFVVDDGIFLNYKQWYQEHHLNDA